MSDVRRLWSVTTLIGEGVPKQALVGWAARIVGERAYDSFRTLSGFVDDGDRDAAIKWLQDARWATSGKAADRGKAVHKVVEEYALGEKPVVPEGFEGYDEQILRFLNDHAPTFEASEASVYNLQYSYAGTLDSIVKFGKAQKRYVLDVKTTDKLPDARSRPPYGEVALQLCAYARAEKVGLTPPTISESYKKRYYEFHPDREFADMPKVEGAFALVISPVDYRLVPVRIDDEVWRAFLAAREVARWSIEISKRVFGPEVTATRKEK